MGGRVCLAKECACRTSLQEVPNKNLIRKRLSVVPPICITTLTQFECNVFDIGIIDNNSSDLAGYSHAFHSDRIGIVARGWRCVQWECRKGLLNAKPTPLQILSFLQAPIHKQNNRIFFLIFYRRRKSVLAVVINQGLKPGQLHGSA